VAGNHDWSAEDGQLFSRLQFSGRRVDIASKRLCCWFSRFDVTYCGRMLH